MSLEITNERSKKFFIGGFTIYAGQTLKMEVFPQGNIFIVELVPVGETWNAAVDIRITKEIAGG